MCQSMQQGGRRRKNTEMKREENRVLGQKRFERVKGWKRDQKQKQALKAISTL